MPSTPTELPSAAFFNPQSKAAEVTYLDSLHTYLHKNGQLHSFAEAIRSLPQTWATLAQDRPAVLASKQGSAAAESLARWINSSDSSSIANGMSASLTLPLLTIIQICQYFQYLEFKAIKHHELLQSLALGGVHGYCGGLLPAVAVAVSANEVELLQNASKALRLAFAIGVYGDLGDEDLHSGPTNMVIRLKYAGQGNEIIRNYPGAYISAVTDPKTISVVGPARVLDQIKTFTKSQGLLSQDVHIRGKVHNPENEELARGLESFCNTHDSFQFPDTSHLQVLVRSNIEGSRLKDQSLAYEVIMTILSARCEWYRLLHNVAADLEASGRESHHLINFGIGDCLSPIPFHQRGFTITKSEARSIIREASMRSSPAQSFAYQYPSKAVAVIGVACRYPSANNVEELWDVISSGTSTVQELPQDRVDTRKNFRLSQGQPSASPKTFYGNFIDRPDAFDHAFFGINSREATYMDPQQRLLLETSYQAVDSSGYLRKHKREAGDNVGVFIGASFMEYLSNTSSHPPTAYSSVGTLRAFLCGRISHYFGWTGPAEVIDTACSSSLVAVNRAYMAIQSGECSLALAGGVNVISSIENFLDLGKAGFLSSTGQCKPFDKDADGYCRSEGAGLLFLKPLDQALRDTDHILGVICGAASNQGGLSSSITVPHSPSQVTLYRKILDQAGLNPDKVTYVEAHGTGTQVGDPLEIASIREVFGGTHRDKVLHIGSIKGNIGHCETAAGIAGCVKALLLLRKGVIPPLASHKSLNCKIAELGPDRMAIDLQKQPWEASFRAICVNSYGAGGSNAAVVLCQPPFQPLADREICHPHNGAFPFLLSAASKPSLMAYLVDLKTYLEKAGSLIAAADVAYTLAEKRQHHRFRFATTSNLTGLAKAVGDGSIEISETPVRTQSVVLVFCGQVGQVIGMKLKLYESCDLVRSHLDRCNEIVTGLGLSPLFPAIFKTDPISDIKTLHCCLFAQQYACAQSWIESGLCVNAVVGHSFGELTALAVSGILSLEDALTLVARRASLIESQWGSERGAMLTVRCSIDDAKLLVAYVRKHQEDLEIACYNTDDSLVLGGSEGAVATVEHVLQTDPVFRSVKHSRLKVTHAYHTRLTESILEDLESVASTLTFKEPMIPFEACTEDHQDKISPKHIRSHVRKPVFFQKALRRLEQRLGSCVWLEAGSDSPTFSLVKRALASPQNHVIQPVKLDTDEEPMRILCDVTANLWRKGLSVSYWNFHSPAKQGFQQVWLPPYHFQEAPHWLPYVDHAMKALEGRQISDGTKDQFTDQRSVECPPLIKQIRRSAADADRKLFEINPGHPSYAEIISGHAVLGRPLCPAGMYLACAIAAARLSVGDQKRQSVCFENCSFESPLGLASDRDIEMSLRMHHAEAKWSFETSSSLKGQAFERSDVHAKGIIGLVDDLKVQHSNRLISRRVKELQTSGNLESLQKQKAYHMFSRIVTYSELFKGISDIKFAGNEAVAEVHALCQTPDTKTDGRVLRDAVALDTFIQVCGLLINSHDSCPSDAAYLAVGVDSLSIAQTRNTKPIAAYTVYAVFDLQGNDQASGDIFAMHDGEVVVGMTGIRFTKVRLITLGKLLDSSKEGTKIGGAKHDQVLKAPESDSISEDVHGVNDNARQHTEGNSLHVLREVIASYTGLPQAQIKGDTNLGALGIDSLAAIELAGDLSARFGSQVSSTSLLEGDLEAICQHLGIDMAAGASQSKLIGTAALKMPRPADKESPPASPGKNTSSTTRQRLVEMVSLHSGHSASAITDHASFGELGIDSLARIELDADIKAIFQTSINDSFLSESTTIKDVLDQIDPELSGSKLSVPGDSTLSSKSSHPMTSMRGSPVEPQKLRLDIDPIQVLDEIGTLFPSSAKKNGFTGFWDAVAPEIDRLMLAYIVEAFDSLGIDLPSLQLNDVVPNPLSVPKHGQLVGRLWTILEQFNLVRRDLGQYFRTSKSLPNGDAARLCSDLKIKFPEYAVDVSLLAVTGPELANCLAGRADPLKLLFGTAGAQQTLSDFYHKSPMLVTMTDQILLFVKRILRQAGPGVIRILEIGAGFGGTTEALAKMLQESDCMVQYTFTDVAPTLVDKARRAFSHYSWMDYATLNIEHDPPAALQGKYDMVIATNVVHATTNLVKSTRRIKSLLKDEGFICLSEVTKILEWHNLVFGLLPGWWCFNDDRCYALQSAEEWMKVFKKAGFEAVSYSTGPSEEAKSQQLLVGATRAHYRETLPSTPTARRSGGYQLQTVVYKTIDDTDIHADIYLPEKAPSHPMPVALMIHGGGYMTLSRSAIGPAQIRFLLSKGVLPISLDHRLCPEIDIIDGPMTDVRDAIAWARRDLPSIALSHGIKVDIDKIAVIGWSTGGHLAMTTAWTTVEAGIQPPTVILNLYGPSDFEALAANHDLGQQYPARTMGMDRIRGSLFPKPITSYDLDDVSDSARLGWLKPDDPRSELVLSLFKEGNGLNILLNGLSDSHAKPVTKGQIDAINPIAQVAGGKYKVPTYIIHGSEDEVVPCEMSIAFDRALRDKGVDSELCVVEGAQHIHDLGVEPGSEMWERGVGPGYQFVLKYLGVEG